MRAVTSEEEFLDRLKANEARNSARFKAAGYSGILQNVGCRRCGLRESIIFWTPRSDDPRDMHFRCPRCGKTELEYGSVAEAAKQDEEPTRSILEWLVVPVMVVLVIAFVMQVPQGRVMAERVWSASRAHLTSVVATIDAARLE